MAARAMALALMLTAAEASTGGWNLLDPDWDRSHPLDLAAIEWEYFMIHSDDGAFNGIVGYVLTNPRDAGGYLGQVVPKGGNVAVGGMFHGGQATGDYVNYGLEGLLANADDKNTFFTNPKLDSWAQLSQNENATELYLKGKTEKFEWNLTVSNAFPELTRNTVPGGPFTPTTDDRNAGLLPGEVWTVDALWPRTKTTGYVVNRATGEKVMVKGKGYRENSWGRYIMSLDGWDFLVFSEKDVDGVTFVLQTYHHSSTLDFMDVGFRHEGEVVRIRYTRDQLRWRHRRWSWHRDAFQCVPHDWELHGVSGDYEFRATLKIARHAQDTFNSRSTIGTSIFMIHEQYPTGAGTITRRSTGEVVKRFSGQAGGEFAAHKGIFPVPSFICRRWGRRFSNN